MPVAQVSAAASAAEAREWRAGGIDETLTLVRLRVAQIRAVLAALHAPPPPAGALEKGELVALAQVRGSALHCVVVCAHTTRPARSPRRPWRPAPSTTSRSQSFTTCRPTRPSARRRPTPSRRAPIACTSYTRPRGRGTSCRCVREAAGTWYDLVVRVAGGRGVPTLSTAAACRTCTSRRRYRSSSASPRHTSSFTSATACRPRRSPSHPTAGRGLSSRRRRLATTLGASSSRLGAALWATAWPGPA